MDVRSSNFPRRLFRDAPRTRGEVENPDRYSGIIAPAYNAMPPIIER